MFDNDSGETKLLSQWPKRALLCVCVHMCVAHMNPECYVTSYNQSSGKHEQIQNERVNCFTRWWVRTFFPWESDKVLLTVSFNHTYKKCYKQCVVDCMFTHSNLPWESNHSKITLIKHFLFVKLLYNLNPQSFFLFIVCSLEKLKKLL